MPEERQFPQGSRVDDLDLSGVHLHGTNLEGARLTETYLMDADISGDIEGLRLNGVEIEPLVRAELDRLYPDRVKLRASDVAGLREAWSMVERLWAATTERAMRLPEAVQRERVGGEWSIVETLRHLVFATDCWLFRAIRLEPSPYQPWGLPWSGAGPEFTHAVGVDTSASPSLEEVMPVRRHHQQAVRETLENLTDAGLAEVRAAPDSPGHPTGEHSVLQCLHVLLNEEWEHHPKRGVGASSLHRARPRRPRPGRGLGFLTALTATRRDDRGVVDFRPLMFRGSADPAIAVAGQTGFKSRSVIGGHTLRAKSRYARQPGRPDGWLAARRTGCSASGHSRSPTALPTLWICR